MATLRRRQGGILFWVGIVLMAVVLAWVVLVVTSLQSASDARQEAIEVLSEDVRALRDQVQATGEEPVAPDPEERVEELPDPTLVGPIGPRGPEGPAGRPPTVEEIRAAVNVVLAGNPSLTRPQIVAAVTTYLQANPPPAGPAGEPGAEGPEGRPPTADEVSVAVATFCAEGACQGPEGPAGGQGPVGPAGPGPTDAQIEAAINTFCGNDGSCEGAPGATGPTGPPGPGRSIVDVDCVDTDSGSTEWVFTFDSDPLEERVEGPCRFDPPLIDP